MQEFFFSKRRGLSVRRCLVGYRQNHQGLIKKLAALWPDRGGGQKHRSHDVGSGGHRVYGEEEKCREIVEDG
jgi:hypothetical protein